MSFATLKNAALGVGRRLAGKPRQGVELEVPFVHLGTDYGGYGIILDAVRPGAIVYSFGLGEDISFDLALLERVDCQIFGFDPTPRSVAWVRSQPGVPAAFQVRELGIADYDGVASFAPPENPAHISHRMLDGASGAGSGRVEFQVRRLSTLMNELGHARLDVLKMDVESAEYAVLDDLLKGSIRPAQLLIEFHHGMHGIPVSRTERALGMLRDAGYKMFDAQPSGHEYSLVLDA